MDSRAASTPILSTIVTTVAVLAYRNPLFGLVARRFGLSEHPHIALGISPLNW